MNYPIPFHPSWEVYDSTKIQEYLDCPRLFFYKRILGWARETPIHNDLQFGKAWHKAKEFLYKLGFSDKAIQIAFYEGFLPTYREVFPEATDDLFSPKTPDNALLALSAYTVYPANARDFDLFDVIETELAGVVPIDSETDIVYKIDLLFRRKDDGKYGVLEHKSKKGSFSRSWTDQWDQSVQIGTYNHALNTMIGNADLSNVEGVTVNGSAFLKTKFDFERVTIHKTRDMLYEYLWQVREYIDRIRLDVESLSECSDKDRIMYAFPKNPQSCTKYYGCEMANFCAAWPNPLQRCQEPPFGYVIDFWDPLAAEAPTKRVDLELKEY